jgi:hypothetical protein
MAGLAQRLRDAFLKPAQKKFKKRLVGLEKRSTTPGQAEKVVVRPDRPVKK